MSDRWQDEVDAVPQSVIKPTAYAVSTSLVPATGATAATADAPQIENPLAQQLLQGLYGPGDRIHVGVDADGHLSFGKAV
jgi:hypothetical protein